MRISRRGEKVLEANIKVNVHEIERRLGNLRDKAGTVLYRAAVRGASAAKSESVEQVAAHYTLKKKGTVKQTITIIKGSYSKPFAEMLSNSGHLNLAYFKASPMHRVTYKRKKNGKRSYRPTVYKAQVKKTGGLKKLNGRPKPFVAVMPKSGFMGVFRRTDPEKVKSKVKSGKNLYRAKRTETRSPNNIEGVSGPSVPQMIKNKNVIEKVEKKANAVMMERLEHEIGLLLDSK